MVTLASPFETDAPRTGFSRHDSRRIAKSAQRFRGAFSYDVKGNLVARPASLQSPALSLVWDFDNKLKGADTNGTPASLEVRYEYDALGRRVARSGPGGNVVYFQAGQQTIADYPRGGVPASATYRYVFGAYIDEPLLRETVSGSVRHFFHRNQQYSVTALTDSAGNTAERYAYTAYGALTVFNYTGTPQATSPLNNRYTYTGREWDDSTKLYHFRARWYDPAAGRFVGRDPLGFVDGMGLYGGYFASSMLDPTGYYLSVLYNSHDSIRDIDCQKINRAEVGHYWITDAHKNDCYFVQKVVLRCGTARCEKKVSPVDPKGVSQCCPDKFKNEDELVYFEAAEIKREGFRVPKENNPSDDPNGTYFYRNHTFGFKAEDSFCGYNYFYADLRVYCGQDVKKEILKWDFKKRYMVQNCGTSVATGEYAKRVGSGFDRPEFWGNQPEPGIATVSYWAKLDYKCCKDESNVKVTCEPDKR